MKFILPIPKANVYSFMRECGYAPMRETESGELVFCRVIGSSRSGYPRFHLYVRPGETETEFNLHLDQKAPMYKGVKAHGGEYNGELVEQEARKIRDLRFKI